MEKLTTWWPDWSRDKEMETNRPWNWRWTVPKTTKIMLVRLLMTNLKMTVRADFTVYSCSPFPQLIKALSYWLSVRGNWPLDRCHQPPVAYIRSKANFPFHQPGLFTGFWAVGSQTLPFSNKSTMWKSYCLTFFSINNGRICSIFNYFLKSWCLLCNNKV